MTLIFSLDKHETIKGCKMKSKKKISFFGFVGLNKLICKIHGIYNTYQVKHLNKFSKDF